jgi:ribosome biogenesis GTPase
VHNKTAPNVALWEDTMTLEDLGWDSTWQQAFAPYAGENIVCARVTQEHREQCIISTGESEGPAVVTGKLRNAAISRIDFPAVGDWVAAKWDGGDNLAVIQHILPRRTSLMRKAAGSTTEEQVIAANVDVVLLVSGLDGDFNPRRIERYATLAWESGATPLVVLNKADLCQDVEDRVREATSVSCGIDVVPVSAATGSGLDAIRSRFSVGTTFALLGSSGVGKSTLINALLGGHFMDTGTVREDDSRGRHTTTHRELIAVPGVGILIDTPGMRELQLWADEASLERTFDDIAQLASQCRFRDCTHEKEPGCAVIAALISGELDTGRMESHRKLKRELEYLARKQDKRLQSQEKAKWKAIHKTQRRIYKERQDSG